MRIVNSMFGKGLGGIEQAFLDYTEALSQLKHEVICVVRVKAKVIPELEKLQARFPKIMIKKIPNISKWDILSKYLLSNLLKEYFPDVVLAHGNRPSGLFKYGTKKHGVTQVGIVHNYLFKDVLRSDFLFCVSEDILNELAGKHFISTKIYKVPNLIRVGAEPKFKTRSEPPVIGVMARMVEKKGVDIFIRALSILQQRKIKFKAMIGGDGDLREKMQALRDELNLNDNVRFIGWVKDKSKFYDDMDIFCLPSLSEPFGIVLLEAMMRKKPIVSTNIEGPAEILEDNYSAILVDRGSSEALADGLEELLLNKEKAEVFADKAFWVVQNLYDISIVSKTLESAIEQVVAKA